MNAARLTPLPAGQQRVPEAQTSSGAAIVLDLLTEDNEKFHTRSAEYGLTRVRAIDWRVLRTRSHRRPCPAPASDTLTQKRNFDAPNPVASTPSRSPVGVAPGGGCLLAVCTTDARLRLYRLPHGRLLRCEEECELSGALLSHQKMKGVPVRRNAQKQTRELSTAPRRLHAAAPHKHSERHGASLSLRGNRENGENM